MMFDKYIEKQHQDIEFLKSVATELQEQSAELKEENDRYDEEQIEEMYKYYSKGENNDEHNDEHI